MSKKHEIKTNSDIMMIKVGLVGFISLVLFILCNILLSGFRSLSPIETPVIGALLRITLAFLAFMTVFVTWREDKKIKYFLQDQSLIIQKKSIMGSGRKQIIPLDKSHITTLEITQSSLGRKLDYGTIVLEVDRYSQMEHYELDKIDDPQSVLKLIQNQLFARK